MEITYLDLKTGRTTKEPGINVYALTEGNWSCDCNRALTFGNGNITSSTCDGCHRYIVIKVKGNFEELTKEEIIRRANEEYYLNLNKE